MCFFLPWFKAIKLSCLIRQFYVELFNIYIALWTNTFMRLTRFVVHSCSILLAPNPAPSLSDPPPSFSDWLSVPRAENSGNVRHLVITVMEKKLEVCPDKDTLLLDTKKKNTTQNNIRVCKRSRTTSSILESDDANVKQMGVLFLLGPETTT